MRIDNIINTIMNRLFVESFLIFSDLLLLFIYLLLDFKQYSK